MLTDLGTKLYLQSLTEKNANSLYTDAIETLVNMQLNASVLALPAYDEALLMQEMELFREWLLCKHLKLKLTDLQNAYLDKLFNLLVRTALQQPRVFVHRDYHSRNLLYIEQNNPGVIDYQDAVEGPLTYDVVSLFKDCYIKWPLSEINRWAYRYLHIAREKLGIQCSDEQFMRWFNLMGVQRQLKASGIFARLYLRDSKSAYLNDIPKTLSYIMDLEEGYPELQDLISLIRKEVLPGLE